MKKLTSPFDFQNRIFIKLFLPILVLILALFSGCQFFSNNGSSKTPAAVQPVARPTSTSLAATAIQRSSFLAWIDPSFPEAAKAQIASIQTILITPERNEAQIIFSASSGLSVGSWTYLVAAPFRSLRTDISSTELKSFWNTSIQDPENTQKIYLSQGTLSSLSLIWGDPTGNLIEVIKPEVMLNDLWFNPDILVIMPFEELTIDWKVLTVDDVDPLASDFKDSDYALNIPIKADTLDLPQNVLQLNSRITNLDPDKLSSVALTGVTALVRDTAVIMEEKGLTYPAQDIQNILRTASITHISNEVPFAEDCPTPDSNQESLYFCSKDSYIELLEAVGTDIVELSGDHFGDWGPEAMLHSLDLYHHRGWLTYGGGETLQQGLDPVFIEHNGNSFAFIGCNGKVHDKYATASASNPGASRCDFDWMINKIHFLAQEGYLVIATMQHEEVNSFYPIAIQLYDFGRLAEAGAVIVSGSQAHHPQAFEYTGSSFIHYGLGNLFFDQWYLAKYNPSEHINKDKAFIDLHYFYDGTHINTRLVSLQFIDNARPRLMDSEETDEFLSAVFQYSIWKDNPLAPITW
jgi:hypothetical protein